MNRRFHQFLGIILAGIYVYVMTHQARLLPSLAAMHGASGVGVSRSSRGLLVIYGLPIAAIVCFVWPERLMWWFSPRIPPDFEYLLTAGFWYLLGYGCLLIGGGLLLLFA